MDIQGGNPNNMTGYGTGYSSGDVGNPYIPAGGGNPYIPPFPTGTKMPPPTFAPTGGSGDPVHGPGPHLGGERKGGTVGSGTVNLGGGSAPGTFPANGPGGNPIPGLSALNPGGNTGGPISPGSLAAPGISSGLQNLLAAFLNSGAGFNPQAIQAILAALGPQIERGQANITEQFGAQGLGNSSAAAIGLADYNSQVTLDEGQIISQMYEQSIQNYLSALGLAKTSPTPSGLGALIGGIGSLAGGLGGLYGGLSGNNAPSTTINYPGGGGSNVDLSGIPFPSGTDPTSGVPIPGPVDNPLPSDGGSSGNFGNNMYF